QVPASGGTPSGRPVSAPLLVRQTEALPMRSYLTTIPATRPPKKTNCLFNNSLAHFLSAARADGRAIIQRQYEITSTMTSKARIATPILTSGGIAFGLDASAKADRTRLKDELRPRRCCAWNCEMTPLA